MSGEDDTDMNGEFEEAPSSVVVSGGEEVEGEEDEVEEEEEDEEVGGEDDEMEEDHSGSGFQTEMMISLDLVKDVDASGAQLYEKLQRIEHEALAQRKRKLDEDQGEGSSKKLRQDETDVATYEEILESMTGSKKRRRKQKKKGRRKGGKNRVSPEIKSKLGEATLRLANGCYEEAISILNDVILLAPNLCDPYHTLGRVYKEMGNEKKAMGCYMIAAFGSPKDTPLWKLLVNWSIEQGNIGQAWYCLPKAITADPKDITLRYLRASLYLQAKDFKNAAESYKEIVRLCPNDVEALKNAIKFYKESGQPERCVRLLEDYIKDHPPESNPSVVDSVASLFIENNDYEKALAYIGNAKKLPSLQDRFQLSLTIKEGICHAHLRNFDKAEDYFSHLKHTSNHSDLITSVANCLLNLEHYDSALKYYLVLEDKASDEDKITDFSCFKMSYRSKRTKSIHNQVLESGSVGDVRVRRKDSGDAYSTSLEIMVER